jgi:hypothetical protein
VENEQDICAFLDRNINRRIPKEKAPWEFRFFENYGNEESAVILIAHHSMGDGMSAQFSFLFSSDDDTPIKQIPIRNVSKWEKIGLSIMGSLLIPLVLIKNTSIYDKPNPINTKV